MSECFFDSNEIREKCTSKKISAPLRRQQRVRSEARGERRVKARAARRHFEPRGYHARELPVWDLEVGSCQRHGAELCFDLRHDCFAL